MGEPIGWQDIRLVTGEGKLTGADVFLAVNTILKRRDDQRDEAFKLLGRLAPDHWRGRASSVLANIALDVDADFRTLKANAEGNMPHTAKLADPPSN